MAEHLSDSVAEAASLHDRREIDRLLAGLNLLGAHLAQTLQRLAYHAERRHIPGLTGRTATQAAHGLAYAGVAAELVAGHLKEAQLAMQVPEYS